MVLFPIWYQTLEGVKSVKIVPSSLQELLVSKVKGGLSRNHTPFSPIDKFSVLTFLLRNFHQFENTQFRKNNSDQSFYFTFSLSWLVIRYPSKKIPSCELGWCCFSKIYSAENITETPGIPTFPEDIQKSLIFTDQGCCCLVVYTCISRSYDEGRESWRSLWWYCGGTWVQKGILWLLLHSDPLV